MANAIYKQGTPKEVGTKTAGSLNTNATVATTATYKDKAPTVSAVAGTPVGKGTIYKAGTPAVAGKAVGINTIR